MGELRRSLTNRQLAYYMAFFNMYPMGDEAMDVRFAAILAKLEGGIGTVQLKRGKIARMKELFKRGFWTRPRSRDELIGKIFSVFKGQGMEMEDDDNE